MRTTVRTLMLASLVASMGVVFVQAQVPAPMPWAYGFLDNGPEPAPIPCPATAKPMECARRQTPRPKDNILTLPDTDRKFAEYAVHYDFGPADWYPGDHPAMPPIVANGRESDTVRACSLCHYPNGHGRAENASPAGLPAEYIIQQLQAFKNGTRKSAEPRKANYNEMIQIARHLTDEEMKQAAAYFSAIKRRPEWVRVVETDTVPKSTVGVNGLFMPVRTGETEPLGRRILEVPQNPDQTDHQRNPRSGWLAYVPVGSVARGEELVIKGGGKTVQCGICHGADLMGMGNVPGIADRQVSYIARQLYDMQAGTRESPMMKPVVARLTEDDIIAIVAYLGSK